MTDQTVPKCADQIVVGDRIPGESLPYRFAKGPAEVLFVCDATTLGDIEEWTFVAYRHEDGYHDSTTVLSGAEFQVIPATDPTGPGYTRADDDAETTQPIAGRIPPHFEDGRAVVEVAGGLIEIDPPEGFIPASAPVHGVSPDGVPLCSHGDDADACQLFHAPLDQDAAEAEGFFLVPHGPVKPPYGSPEREAYDRDAECPSPIGGKCMHPMDDPAHDFCWHPGIAGRPCDGGGPDCGPAS